MDGGERKSLEKMKTITATKTKNDFTVLVPRITTTR